MKVEPVTRMKAYVLSLAIGILVGIIYALFQVRSPAPPVIALVGLLGILVGERLPPLLKQAWSDRPALAQSARPEVDNTAAKAAHDNERETP